MVTASTPDPASVTPLTFALGIVAFIVAVALIGALVNAARYLRAAHQRGMARVSTTADREAARREAERNRHLRRVRRTVIDMDAHGNVTAISTARRAGR